MSEQDEAKERMGYSLNPIAAVCPNCKNYRSEIKKKSYGSWETHYETNKRCLIGGFVVKKKASCKLFDAVQNGEGK